MTTLRAILSALAAISVGLIVPGLVLALQGSNNSRATGLAAVLGGFVESFFTPWFWILAVLFFALFFAASQFNSKPLRVLLFWTPTIGISALSISLFSLFTYLWLHFRRT